MGFNSVSTFNWNEKSEKELSDAELFLLNRKRRRDNAFYRVFEFQTSTSLATPARQKTDIVSDRGALYK